MRPATRRSAGRSAARPARVATARRGSRRGLWAAASPRRRKRWAGGCGLRAGCSGWGSTALAKALLQAQRAWHRVHTPMYPAVPQKKRKGGGGAAGGGGAQPPVDPEARKEGDRRFQVRSCCWVSISMRRSHSWAGCALAAAGQAWWPAPPPTSVPDRSGAAAGGQPCQASTPLQLLLLVIGVLPLTSRGCVQPMPPLDLHGTAAQRCGLLAILPSLPACQPAPLE